MESDHQLWSNLRFAWKSSKSYDFIFPILFEKEKRKVSRVEFRRKWARVTRGMWNVFDRNVALIVWLFYCARDKAEWTRRFYDKREFIINRNVWSFQSRRNSVLFFSPFRFYSRKILQPHWDWPPPRKKKYLQEDIPFQGVNGWRTGVSGAQACQEEIEIATFTRHFVPVMNNGDINWRRSISYVKRLTNI